MKICYLCSDLGIPLTGHKGASAHVRGFVRALTSLGHDVVVIASSGGSPDLDVPVVTIPRPDFLADLPLEENPRVIRAMRHLCNNIPAEQALKDTIDKFHPDLIYERYSPFASAGSIIAKKRGIPHVLEVNALLADEGRKFRNQALQEACEFLEHTAFEHTSLIVTVSSTLKDALIELGVSAGKIVDVPNGVDEMFFRPPDIQREDGNDRIVIGFVGSLKPWHAIDVLAESFRALASDSRFHLLIVGDGPLMKPLKKLEKEFPGRVRLTGGINHDEVPAYIHAMDIAVAPYPSMENFYFSPLKVFEYMALGRAVVATGIGQINNLIRHGETGLLVEPEDQDGLVQALRKLSEDNELRRKLGRQAAEEARERHSWKHRAASVLTMCDDRGILRAPLGRQQAEAGQR